MVFARHDSVLNTWIYNYWDRTYKIYVLSQVKEEKIPIGRDVHSFSRIQPLIASYAPGDGAVIPTQTAWNVLGSY